MLIELSDQSCKTKRSMTPQGYQELTTNVFPEIYNTEKFLSEDRKRT